MIHVQTMLNMSGRRHQIPLHLASLAQQILSQTAFAYADEDDDCNAVNLYLLGRGGLKDLQGGAKSVPHGSRVEESTITHLLSGIHAAASIEVLRFAERLGIDGKTLNEVFQNAAGSSFMFDKISAQISDSSPTSISGMDSFKTIQKNLVSLFFQSLGSGPLFKSQLLRLEAENSH